MNSADVDVDELGKTDSIPMLCLWLTKHIEDEGTVSTSLSYLRSHASTGHGCQAIVGYLQTDTLKQIAELYRGNESVCLLLLQVIKQLIDCNLTRDILLRSPTVVLVCQDIGSTIAETTSMSELLSHCLMKCCCSEVCRQVLISQSSFEFMKRLCQRFVNNAPLVRSVLKYLNWVSTSDRELKLLFKFGAVGLCIKIMRRHLDNPVVIRPGVQFLYRSCEMNTQSLLYLIRKSAVSLLVRACTTLANDEEFLVMGLKVIRQMSQTKEGWEQLGGIPGAWQSLCQGTVIGNSLVHDLQGDFSNPGWCIGEMKFPPLKEKQKLLDASIEGTRARTRVNWSVRTLKDFMKTTSAQFALAINLEYDEAQFEVLSSLDLLPVPGEQQEDWYIRLFKYEKTNEVRIDDMVKALLEIRRRELSSVSQELDDVKPIFVAGERITAESLELQDLSAEDAVRGYNADELDDT